MRNKVVMCVYACVFKKIIKGKGNSNLKPISWRLLLPHIPDICHEV